MTTKQKNPWRTIFIVLTIVAIFLIAFNIAIQPLKNIHAVTGISNVQQLYSINKAINNNPIHKVILCDQFNQCLATGRLT